MIDMNKFQDKGNLTFWKNRKKIFLFDKFSLIKYLNIITIAMSVMLATCYIAREHHQINEIVMIFIN